MYYDYNDAEKARIQIAAILGVKIDPIGYADMAAVIFYSLVIIFGIAANIYVWINRRYAPLKAKNLPLMTGVYVHVIFFFLGDLTLCGLVHLRGPLFSNCIFMLIWLRTLLGNYSLGAWLMIRSYTLYRVFCLNKPSRGFKRAVPYLIFIAFVVTMGLVVSFLPKTATMLYLKPVEACRINPTLVTGVACVLWAMWTGFLIMMYLLRNIRSSFNEFREMALSLAALIFVTAYNQIIVTKVPKFPTKLGWRLSLVTIDMFVANYIWWMIMGKTVYKCMFHHDEYLLQWKQKMFADGLYAHYGMDNTDCFDNIDRVDTELSCVNSTLVTRKSVDTKLSGRDASYTESTRMALERLASLSISCNARLDSDVVGWRRSDCKQSGSEGKYSHFRHSISSLQNSTCRKNSAGSSDILSTEIGMSRKTSTPHDKMASIRMLAQRASHHFRSRSCDVQGDKSSSIVLIPEEDVAAATHLRNLSGSSKDIGSSMVAGDYASLRRNCSAACLTHGLNVRPLENLRWQRSDTDLSQLSSEYSGRRRLI